jgi:hypothetical protein
MRRLAVFAFITVAFCPPTGMLLMLAYAEPLRVSRRPLGLGQAAKGCLSA